MQNHVWRHDKTANNTYAPRECDGTFTPKREQNPNKDAVGDRVGDSQGGLFCEHCGKVEGAHMGIPITDHSKCLLTCEGCGKQVPCNKLLPQTDPCEPIINQQNNV